MIRVWSECEHTKRKKSIKAKLTATTKKDRLLTTLEGSPQRRWKIRQGESGILDKGHQHDDQGSDKVTYL